MQIEKIYNLKVSPFIGPNLWECPDTNHYEVNKLEDHDGELGQRQKRMRPTKRILLCDHNTIMSPISKIQKKKKKNIHFFIVKSLC